MLGHEGVPPPSPLPLVHKGFKEAFMSVKDTVRLALDLATGRQRGGLDGWTILVTGHSLGVSRAHHGLIGTRDIMACVDKRLDGNLLLYRSVRN
jgi:hypothetical protein